MSEAGANDSTRRSEVRTFFGPDEAPLFGAVHMPVDGVVRGGVLLCASLGKDGVDTIRAQRLMADALADRGLLVLRFDYLGTGNSSYPQLRPDAVVEWRDSVGHAARFLAEHGVDDISAIAMRAGGLILDSALAETDGIRRIAYWDPVSTGRRYLREQTSFFKMAVGDDDVPAGVVSIIGLRLAAPAVAVFSKLKLGGDSYSLGIQRLVVSRANEGIGPWASAVDSGLAESVLVDGFVESAQPTRILPPTPLHAVDAVVDWLDKQVPDSRRKITPPAYSDTARIADGEGGFVTERIESIGPHAMFGIRAVPDVNEVDPGPLPAVVFFTNANNGHQGPNREWVELSRRVADAGGQAVRWDRRGAAESGVVDRDEAVYIYSEQGTEDTLAVIDHVRPTARALQLAGPCSGGWYSALGAVERGADSVVLVNALQWVWRMKKSAKEPIKPEENDVADWEKSPRARLRRAIQKFLPNACWRMMGRAGLVQAPEILLAPLARRGIAATVILCPEDTELFAANGGRIALQRLRRSAVPPVLISTESGDHANFHQGVFPELRRVVVDFVSSR
jgi:pimeloyl-ACP methyl ester carboxylesterase